ncbi:TPA: hypothetical protein DCX66_03025 [Candidatus Nomurabacteria bacterium]|nr:hypothetical protein [Candidatus Nomurabacteria bacterium]HAX65417.1 hypothetical protein [Candidatus Nomurabacteria bacterium]
MCQESIISMYNEKVAFYVYCSSCYKSDKWEAGEYAQNYDFSKAFFTQWKELFNKVSRQSLWQFGDCIDSEYANFVYFSKNVYLSSSIIDGSEDVYFSNNVDGSKQVIDSFNVLKSELIYQNISGNKNYNCQYSYWSTGCIDCNFILDCNNCQDCFGCVNLQNKRYCIWNIQYTKEQYEEKMKELNTGKHSFVEEFSKIFWEFTLEFPRKHARIINSIDSTGDELRNNKNTSSSFNVYDSENLKYTYRCVHAKDSMDICHSYAEHAYEHAFAGAENSQNIKFVITGEVALSMVEYLDACKSSSNLFGCIGLKNKQYCILNKQYTKEEYEEMIPKIKQHMDEMPYIDSKGRVYKYGEFFPYELCPFGYNEAVINDHFPLTKEETIERGYPYKEKIDNKYTITLKAKDIPDDIKDVDDSILNEVIECEASGKAFKITPFELQFYKRMNIPIPRLHPDERYKKRLALRNPMTLYTRTCMNEGCTNTFETTYAPNRPEIVYCKECYQREVY